MRAQLTSFVGRAEELAQVGERLQDTRLVTLIGPGGAGKTRLAMEAAAQSSGDVCFVQFAPVAGDTGVAGAVLDALEIRATLRPGPDHRPADPVTRLTSVLADRELLLVLDNCEHLIAAIAGLTDLLLAACPSLRVLATSREALGITGESILPVAPLRLPPPDTGDPLAYPSVRLFADRAAAVQPSFVVTPDNAQHVMDICRALDGLPLGIELAAARLRTLPVAEVAARLDDRFKLLTRGSRTALPRHQTLRAVVAWSWDLLDEREQRLARRLTVFVRGARPESAERVCGLPEEVLFSLAEKSLVEFTGGRYRMLDTIRAFCAEKLAEAGEVDELRDAHAAHYLELAITADPYLRRAEQLEWLARLDEESGDLVAALRWAIASGQYELAQRLMAYCSCYWWFRGHRVDSGIMAVELLSHLGRTPPEHLKEEYAMVVLVSGWAVGGEELRERLGVVNELLPMEFVPERLDFLMMMKSMFVGPPDDFEHVHEMLQEVAGSLSPWPQALSRCGNAFMLELMGRVPEAKAMFERSLADFRKLGERWGITVVLSGLGALSWSQGDYETSYAMADEGLKTAAELGSAADMAESLCQRGDALLAMGRTDEALADFGQAAELSRRSGSVATLTWAHLGLGELALAQGDRDEALARIRQADELCPDDWYSVGDTRLRIDTRLAELAPRTGDR
ncbi:tetratricopeptide repeat protein [Nonomuraea sp. NN258]|nr:tetratricopeptide repeat protein [Nonomuraea antri]